jgi:hypothetical protein
MRKIWFRFLDPWWKNVTSLGVFTWNVPWMRITSLPPDLNSSNGKAALWLGEG